MKLDDACALLLFLADRPVWGKQGRLDRGRSTLPDPTVAVAVACCGRCGAQVADASTIEPGRMHSPFTDAVLMRRVLLSRREKGLSLELLR
jgi:hypothetical protein